MQNIKPLQTSKPKIMSNKEAMEELERYKPKKNLKSKTNLGLEKNYYFSEAINLYGLINQKIGKWEDSSHKGCLYHAAFPGSVVETDANALMGVLSYLLGEKNEALELYDGINSLIGKKDGLYCWSLGLDGTTTGSNAAMGALCVLLNKKDEARGIYNKLNESGRKDKETGLYNRAGVFDSRVFTDINASMGILCLLLDEKTEAKELYKNIKFYIEKENGLYRDGINYPTYKHGINYPTVELCCNATMGILCKLLNKNEEVKNLYKKINDDKIIGKENGLYKMQSGESDKVTFANAAMAVLNLLLSGKELK